MTDYVSAWKNPRAPYHREACNLVNDLWHGKTTREGRVIRWTSNGQVPPADIIALAVAAGIDVDPAACDAARSADLRAFVSAYRANPPKVTAEQRAEMRAAFGPGTTVVNVITGRKFKV